MSGVKLKVGCKDNNDCAGGLECQGEGVERKCQDFNECTDPRFKSDADAFCGANADCVNSVGSFYCTCHSGEQLSYLNLTERLFFEGYDYWTQDVGCAEVNECTDPKYIPSMNSFCGPNTHCHNTIASYYCTCKLGFEIWKENSGKITNKIDRPLIFHCLGLLMVHFCKKCTETYNKQNEI